MREPRYLSVYQAAEVFEVTPATVYRWIHSGKLEANDEDHPSGYLRIPIEEVRRMRDVLGL